MAYFSPSLMSQLGEITSTVRTYHGTSTQRMYHWTGTLSEFFAFYRAATEDHSAAGRIVSRRGHARDPEWLGLNSQTVDDYLQTSRSIDAQTALHNAVARLDVKGKAAAPEYRVSGGVWSVPRYLSGHPQAAIYRPKTAKPHKSFEVSGAFSSFVESGDVAKPLARIARAAWDYQKQGGSVSLVSHYVSIFRAPQDGFHGLQVSIKVPLSDVASIATSLCVQTYRLPILCLGVALSGRHGDSLHCGWLVKPGCIPIDGLGASDEKALAAASIK